MCYSAVRVPLIHRVLQALVFIHLARGDRQAARARLLALSEPSAIRMYGSLSPQDKKEPGAGPGGGAAAMGGAALQWSSPSRQEAQKVCRSVL